MCQNSFLKPFFNHCFIGNSAWLLKNGESFGETQSCFTSETSGTTFINHPIDVQYEVASSEGWPLFVCEVCLTILS